MDSDHIRFTADARMADVTQAADDSLQRSSGQPHRQGAADRSVPNSIASRLATDRGRAHRCHASSHRPAPCHGHRASPCGGAPARKVRRGREHHDRLNGGRSPRPGCGPHVSCPDEGRCRSCRPSRAPGPRGARAAIRASLCGGSEGVSLPASRSGSHARPSVRKRNGDRRSPSPMAPAARSSERMYQVPDSRRSAARRLPTCRDRTRKVRPQWDHLPAKGCFEIFRILRADRRTTASLVVLARRAGGLPERQMSRKSGLRRSHSQAKPRASNAVRA